MSISMALLAMLDEGATHGFGLRGSLEERTGGVWPINVGQVYTTLARMERDGLVHSARARTARHRPIYGVTPAGRARLAAWLREPGDPRPARDASILKVAIAASRGSDTLRRAVAAERQTAEAAHAGALAAASRAGDDPIARLVADGLAHRATALITWLDSIVSEPEPDATPKRRGLLGRGARRRG